jgi:hypothetical protein
MYYLMTVSLYVKTRTWSTRIAELRMSVNVNVSVGMWEVAGVGRPLSARLVG